MNESSTSTTQLFTATATLAAIGMKLRERKVFEPIEQMVHIAQKTVKDTPTQKLYDALISILVSLTVGRRCRTCPGSQALGGGGFPLWSNVSAGSDARTVAPILPVKNSRRSI